MIQVSRNGDDAQAKFVGRPGRAQPMPKLTMPTTRHRAGGVAHHQRAAAVAVADVAAAARAAPRKA